nr:MAG TPA: Neurensin [Caudoviricetes sp.]
MNFLDLNADGKTDSKDLQIWASILLLISGIVLIFLGFFSPPIIGQIHTSVITTSGELFTFASCLMGLNLHYNNLLQKTIASMQQKKEEEE